ncbi:MAG: hypothetical protein ACOC0Q_01455 [Wenzhouxiangella sp.]
MSNDPKYNGSSLISGGRLVELVIVALVSAAISGGITAFVATAVLQEQLASLKESQENLSRELRELRRDIYRPAWPRENTMQAISPADLIAELRASLLDSAQYFQGTPGDPDATPDPVPADPDADFRRHLQTAAADLGKRRGMTLLAEVQIEAGRALYDLPADALYVTTPLWGTETRPTPWADNHPGPLPRARIVRYLDSDQLQLTPAPTRHQIEALGSTYRYLYAASLWDGDTQSDLSLSDDDRALLLLRAQAEACRELAMQGLTKPVETRTSQAMPRNATPAALYQALMAEFNERAGRAA